MVSYRGIKFIDQTRRTIKKQNGTLPKKKQPTPGTAKLSFSKKSRPTTKTLPSVVAQKIENEWTVETLKELSTDGLWPISEYNTPSVFDKELSELIQPAESYGFTGFTDSLEEPAFNFFDSIETDPAPSKELHGGLFDAESLQHVPPLTSKEVDTFLPHDHNNEIRLVHHYCRVLSNFFSVKNPEWNFYAYVIDHLVHRYVPLRNSLLAWSALHISVTEGTSNKVAYEYYNTALEGVMKHNFLEGDVPVEMLLITAFFLIQFDIMAGTKHSYHILRHVWSTLRIGRLFTKGEETQTITSSLGAFGYQVVTWLLYTDIKSALFHGNISFPDYFIHGPNNTHRNPNIEYLSTSKEYDDRAVANIFSRSRKLLSGVFGSRYPPELSKDDAEQERILVLMVRDMMMFGRLIRLRNWLNQCGNSTEFDSNALQEEIAQLHADNKKQLFIAAESSSRTMFHVLIENALINAIIIFFDRICHPDIRTNAKCQEAASEIINIAYRLRALRSHGTPGSTQWPFPLFLAGIETTDVIHQNWIAKELKECDDQGWGLHMGKTRILLDECINRQRKLFRRVDVGEVMEATTGVFIV